MDEQVLNYKARELAELMFQSHGDDKQIVTEHFLPHFQAQVKQFFEEYGRWPVFRKDHTGGHGASVVLE